MRTIWKYELPISDKVSVPMPRGAQVLSVAEQYGKLCVWALVSTTQEKEPQRFGIYGTGLPAEDAGAGYFLGTVVMPNGLVWHVFREEDCW